MNKGLTLHLLTVLPAFLIKQLLKNFHLHWARKNPESAHPANEETHLTVPGDGWFVRTTSV